MGPCCPKTTRDMGPGVPIFRGPELNHADTGVMVKWGPPKLGTPGPHIPGKIGTWVPIFLVIWGPR